MTDLSAEQILRSFAVPQAGRMYDLSSGWWRHMPTYDSYPRFEVITYSSPQGERIAHRHPFDGNTENDDQYGYVSELVSGALHTGTHIDALCHVTRGPNDEWHGGVSANDALGDYGAESGDASELPALVGRGVLLDIPKLLGLPVLPPHFAIGEDELRRAAAAADVAIEPGDVVLVRTGQMRFWPDVDRIRQESEGSGVALDGARWLVESGARCLGADTMAFEVRPSTVPGSSLPVHLYLLQEQGVHIMEWVNCEELAADGVSTFLFLALPLTVRGGSGSMIRPVAIA